MKWTLQLGSVEQTLAAWGISGLQRRRASQAIDTVGFAVDGLSVDGPLPIAVDAEISIKRDGVQWFVGRVISARRGASGREERADYEVAGPWWYLQSLVYQQVWKIFGTELEVKKSHCLLNTWAAGGLMGVREQIHEALEWARSRAEIAYGSSPFQWTKTDLPDAQIPADEVRDVTCAEVVAKQLRWMPDAVTWWDYATNPPTFHCRRRSGLSARTLAIPGARCTDLEVTPREDLVVPSVVLKYERTDTVDGVDVPSVSTDIAPEGATGEEFGALVATVDLQGFSASYATVTIETGSFPALSGKPADLAAWWGWLKAKEPWLASAKVTLNQVVSVTRALASAQINTLPRELVAGQIPPWMAKTAVSDTVTIVAKISVSEAGREVDVSQRTFTVNVIATDAISGTYTQLVSGAAGEYAPVGLARVVYDALSVLDYEGSLTLVDEEVGEAVPTIGEAVSITGLNPDWSSMSAMVQEVSESVDQGTTHVRFGPPQHLGPRDLVELLRVNRYRLVYTAAAVRAGTSAGAGAGIGLGNNTPKENATSGAASRQKLVLQLGNGYITLDAALAAGHEVTLREVRTCVNGVDKRMLLLCSEPYD